MALPSEFGYNTFGIISSDTLVQQLLNVSEPMRLETTSDMLVHALLSQALLNDFHGRNRLLVTDIILQHHILRHVRAILTIVNALFSLHLLGAVEAGPEKSSRLEVYLTVENIFHHGEMIEVPAGLSQLINRGVPDVNLNILTSLGSQIDLSFDDYLMTCFVVTISVTSIGIVSTASWIIGIDISIIP